MEINTSKQVAEIIQHLFATVKYADKDNPEDASLLNAIEELGIDIEDLSNLKARSFNDAGIRERDNGVVLQLPSGAEFQITVVKSR